MKVVVSPKYKPLTQQAYCCVPTCMQMILSRRRFRPDSQEEIGWHLGLIVPEAGQHLFKKVRVGKKPKAGYGTRMNLKKYSLNTYFEKKGLPLRMELKTLAKVGEVGTFLTKNIKEGKDVIVCFYNEKLFGKGKWGHVCLIQGIDTVKKTVTLIDPEKKEPKIREVNLDKLMAAVKFHENYSKTAGFWVFKTINQASF